MSNSRSGSFIGGLLLGTALGTVTGLLLAPRSGRETRNLLRKSADALPELVEDLSTTLQLHADRLSDSAKQSWAVTLERLQVAIAEGMEASQQQRQLLEQANNVDETLYPTPSDHPLPPD
uniref:Gas vesicle protein n=1 Tax=Cyanothece sp. (strain PCC 7425 / ATCC 29141) TaxID=395961 RepID=B8HLI0_CYAP4